MKLNSCILPLFCEHCLTYFILQAHDVDEVDLEESSDSLATKSSNEPTKKLIKSPKYHFLENLRRKQRSPSTGLPKSHSVSALLSEKVTKLNRRKLYSQTFSEKSFEEGFVCLDNIPNTPDNGSSIAGSNASTPQSESSPPLNRGRFWRGSKYKPGSRSSSKTFLWSSNLQSKGTK